MNGIARAARRPSPRAVLAAILVSHLVLAAAYARTTPPWETPDEPWHMGYIVWLRETHRLPPPTAAMLDTPVRQEASQAPLYYAAAALATAPWSFGRTELAAAFIENPTRFKGVGLAPRQHNYALHGPWDAPDRPIIRALRAARAVASLFGALAVWAVWRLARVVRPSRPWLAVGAAALAAWTPQLVYLSAAASNDTAVAALSTLALAAAIAFPRRPSARGAAGLGALYGLAALAKSSALALGPLVALAILVGAWRTPAGGDGAPRAGDRDLGGAARRAARWAALAGAAALLTGGWWYVRNIVGYGTLFGQALHLAMPWAHRTPHGIGRLISDHAFDLLFMSYWAVFGWGTVRYPAAVYAVARLACAAAGGALAWSAARALRRAASGGGDGARARRPDALAELRAAAWGYGMCGAWSMIVFVALINWMRLVEANWGRLLYPAFGAIAVLLASGLERLPRRGVWLGAAATLLFAWSSSAPVVALRRAYGPLPRLSAAEVQALDGRLDWRMDDAVTLLSFAPLEPAAANPGFWPVRLCWRAIGRPAFEPSVFVHVVGAADRIVASYDGTPGGGTWPGGAWRAGEALCERIDVAVGETDRPIPAPAVYRVAVGMFDRATERRMATFDAAGQPVVGNFVGTVKVAGPPAPRRGAPAPVRFGDGGTDIRLADAAVGPPSALCAGAALTLSLALDVLAPPGDDLQLLVHVRRPGVERPAAQGDGPVIQQGLPYPSSRWSAGERLEDTRRVELPGDLAPGRYEAAIGLYRLADLARLPLTVDGVDAPSRAYVLPRPIDVRRCP